MILDKIKKPNDIHKIPLAEFPQLAEEIRSFLIESVSRTGGHLASNLGVVELTLALHNVLDFPDDKLIWDVGHQAYTHKILTGRKGEFETLRKEGGLSGFPKRGESNCDSFDAGHSSDSISAGLGYVHARDLLGENYHVVSVIGDGALTGGMAYEALNNAAELDTNFIIVLNDNNKMSGFIEENPDILQQLSSIQDQKVISLIETLGIVFTNVSIANVSEEILRYVFENQCYELNDTMIRRIVEFENDTMLSGLDTRNYTTIISLGYEPLIKYIQENLKQYVKEIILAPNNTKEDVEQIMDLLERMLENAPEETEICLELVNHEEFCVDDISECCGKFDSDFDKDVKILWDELLDKGKVSLKWENIKCYWDRYKITPELLQYIETNSDQLTFLENQCLNEVFAEELITSTIDDSAFEKLLPQLELEFDIPIEKVERQKVGILIKKKYIPFDVNKYGEIKDAYLDLCPDFILYNQAEYMEVMEKIPMGETLLETLLLSPILDFSNAEVLLDAFGENYMTAKIAENLVDSNVTINKSIFTAAWEYVDEKGKKTLMFKCLSILEAADFENCFSELSQWYSGFCDRSKKHSVELPNNEESQRLAKRLQEVSYITSYKLQEKEVYDSVTETKKKKSTFVCWIKAIKG